MLRLLILLRVQLSEDQEKGKASDECFLCTVKELEDWITLFTSTHKLPVYDTAEPEKFVDVIMEMATECFLEIRQGYIRMGDQHRINIYLRASKLLTFMVENSREAFGDNYL